MTALTPEERALATYEAACLRRDALGKDMIRSPGPAQTQRIFRDEIAHALRAAEASARAKAFLECLDHAEMCEMTCSEWESFRREHFAWLRARAGEGEG